MRDYKTSKYNKTIGITEKNYKYILETKYKKSLSGRLNEIIDYYVSLQKVSGK